MKVTAQQAMQNFNNLSAELIRTAPTAKAVAFAEKIIAQISAKGDEWIVANAQKLQICSDWVDQDIAPVADNRVYYMGEFQMALLGH